MGKPSSFKMPTYCVKCGFMEERSFDESELHGSGGPCTQCDNKNMVILSVGKSPTLGVRVNNEVLSLKKEVDKLKETVYLLRHQVFNNPC